METFTVDQSILDAAQPPPPGTDAPPDPPSEGSAKTTAHPAVIVGAFVALALVWCIATNLIHDPLFAHRPASVPLEGLTIFAVFFVAAQGLERLLEPLTQLIEPPKDQPEKAAEATEAVREAVGARNVWVADPTGGEKSNAKAANKKASEALDAAAGAKAATTIRKADMTVAVWAVASCLGVLASAALQLYLLRTVGIASPPRVLEILATGLIIGGGTKPLHDFVKLIEAKKETAKEEAKAAVTLASRA